MPALVVGNIQHAEFAGPLALLRARTSVHAFDSVAAALDWLTGNDGVSPVVEEVVLAQSRPLEILPGEVELLRRAAPLARFTALLGSWCEGEARTGKPFPDVERKYWHAFAPEALPAERPGAFVGVYAWRWEDLDALAAALQPIARGMVWLDPRRLPQVDGLDVIVWNGRYGDAEEQAEMAQVLSRYAHTPVVGLFSFPRVDDAAPLKQLGVGTILGKPFCLSALQTAVLSALGVAI